MELKTKIKSPRICKYYIYLRYSAFNEYICGWIGSIHFCYLLKSAIIDVPFDLSGGAGPVNFSESYEELVAPGRRMEMTRDR